jgi:hypothetical protein
MRKLRLLAFVGALAIIFSACEKDEDFTIVGKWNVDKTTISLSLNGIPLGEDEVSVNDGWIEFKSGGTGIYDDSGTFNWTLSGSNLTITDPEETIVLKLTKMEENKVVGEFSESYTEDGLTVTMKMVIELSRL